MPTVMKNSLFPVELLLIIHRKLDFDSRAAFENVFGWNRISHKIVVANDFLQELNNMVQPPEVVFAEDHPSSEYYQLCDTYFIYFPNGMSRWLRLDKVTRNVLNMIDSYYGDNDNLFEILYLENRWELI